MEGGEGQPGHVHHHGPGGDLHKGWEGEVEKVSGLADERAVRGPPGRRTALGLVEASPSYHCFSVLDVLIIDR